jgi:hypothetical protein
MIKYTILYKNGKTWNGKVNRLYDLARPANDAVLLWVKGESGSSIYIPGVCSSWTNVPGTSTGKKPIRKPNPASVTKKQKKFDEDYARWVRDWHLRGSSDITMQAYKKWLWEQKQAELRSVLKETSLDEFVRVSADLKEHLKGGIPVDKAFALCTQRTWDELGWSKQPIKTTYTFWLGQDGSVSDEL